MFKYKTTSTSNMKTYYLSWCYKIILYAVLAGLHVNKVSHTYQFPSPLSAKLLHILCHVVFEERTDIHLAIQYVSVTGVISERKADK